MFANEAFLDQLIANQRRAIRYYLIFAVGLFVLGIVVMTLAYLSSGWLIPETFKGLFGIGGAFFSSLSAFPVKEILSRKEKLGIFETIKRTLEQTRDSADMAERKQVDDLLWQVIQKTALG